MSFADTVRATIEQVDRAPHTTNAVAFHRVLHEFAAGLSMAGIGAEVQSTRDPRTVLLRAYPQHRPARACEIARFTFDGHEIVVAGDVPRRISSPSDLEQWLLCDFVQGSMLPRVIRDLREAAEERASARVCYHARTVAPTDFMATMSADQHRAACEADFGVATEIRAAVDWRLFNSKRMPRAEWVDYLREVDAEGVLFRVASIEENDNDNCLRLRVARVTPAAPAARPVAPHLPST